MIVIATNSDWFITQFAPAMIGQSNYFDISFMTFNRLYSVALETSTKERLMRGNLFRCKLSPPPHPVSLHRMFVTVQP